MADDLMALADEKYVSLTTFKRNGEGVAAPVWLVADGGGLLVWTPADSWKVKRLGRDPRVTLVRCGRRGQVPDGALPVEGTAEVVDDPSVVAKTEAALKRKYGFEYRVVTLIERIAARGSKPRVVITITPG
ncbi:MAG: PPOX class F420-dependent oxidoreductase [Mycobacterium sp.]